MDITKYPLAFDGNTFVGPNVRDVVYLWTENGKPVYVGITKQGIHERCFAHMNGSNYYLFQRKLRSNLSVFRCYIIDQFYLDADPDNAYQHLLDLEVKYIAEYGTKPPSGYNLTDGGEGSFGRVVSNETRLKLSNANKGRKLSDETRNRMSVAMSNKHPMYGKHHTEETRRKIAEANKGRKHTEETRRKMSIRRAGRKYGPQNVMWRLHISEAKKGTLPPNTGKKHSDETRRRISEALKKHYSK